MTELKTLKDIEKEFYEIKQDGNFLNCLYACRKEGKEWATALKRAATRGEPMYPPCFHKEHDKYLKDWQEVYLSMATLLGYIFNLEEK
jgi:hypothetical protein